MLPFTNILFLATAFAAATGAVPSALNRRARNGLYLCEKPNWKGACAWLGDPAGAACQGYTDWTGRDMRFRSFGPDQDRKCKGWAKSGCRGPPDVQFVYPGTGDTGIDIAAVSCRE